MKKLVTKKDFILLVVVLAIGVVGIILAKSTDKGATATIKVDGKVVETISLYVDTLVEYNGVIIATENGEVYVKDSTCTDKVCMRSGKASKSGEGIICAPNRVSIQIDGNNNDLPDAMTG